jgi:ribonuclease HI
MRLTVFTDGASRGNPGHASYGFVVLDEDKKIIFEEGKYLGIQTNNFAEYSAVLSALEYLKNNYSSNYELIFFMDSLLVASQLSGRYKIKSPNLKLLTMEIKKLEIYFSKVNYNHIPREKNKLADKLANLALDNR